MGKKGDIWKCDPCGGCFNSEEELEKHEVECKKSPAVIKGSEKRILGVWQGFKFGLGFGLGFILIGLIVFGVIGVLGPVF
jgi:hypothetical protein